MVKVRDLEPQLLRIEEPGKRYRYVDALAEAQGIRFECPQCGNHQVIVWFKGRGAPEEEVPLPRWAVSGTGIDDLTLAPSINVAGCWHGFVQGGQIR